MSKNNTLKKRIAVLEAEKKALISKNESLSGIARDKHLGNTTPLIVANLLATSKWLENNITVKDEQEKPLFVNSKGDKFAIGDYFARYFKLPKRVVESKVDSLDEKLCIDTKDCSELFKTKQEAIDFGKRFEAEKWVGKTVFIHTLYIDIICKVDNVSIVNSIACICYSKIVKNGVIIDRNGYLGLNNHLIKIREATEEEKALLNPNPIVFTNSIGEEFTKEYFSLKRVYVVYKEDNNIELLDCRYTTLYSGSANYSEIYKTKKGAEAYVAAHPLKVELVRGEWYQNKIGNYGRYNKGLKWFSFVCNNGSSPYISIWDKATQGQIKQGEAEEVKAGKFWSKEKCDYLGLEDVCYEFDNIADLLDIDKIMPISTWRDQTNSRLIETRRDSHIIHDYSLHYKDGELRTTINVIYVDKKQSVTKETFLTLLKNHK